MNPSKKALYAMIAFLTIQCASKRNLQVTDKKHNKTKVHFTSEGKKLVGDVYLPPSYDPSKKYPALVIVGSWTTVKEQMAGLYAKEFAKKGFITLAFDFRNYGESEGNPRFYESPESKIQDIRNAAKYLTTSNNVQTENIGGFGVCAGAGYMLEAANTTKDIKTLVTAASWLHDGEAVKLFYGGERGVDSKIQAAQKAKRHYSSTGDVTYIPTISTKDKSAAMYGPYDYYLNPKRGAISQWSADKFAVMSWEDWLKFNPMPSAKKLQAPVLMIHSDGAVLPKYTKKYFEDIAIDDKKLIWMDSSKPSPFEQFDFYDSPDKVNFVVKNCSEWFKKHLQN
ncbi:MAG: alpha/beta hydrolase [Spirochaetota bacterium]